eukprot:15118141-Ditylum_brightwellii.AAC.1
MDWELPDHDVSIYAYSFNSVLTWIRMYDKQEEAIHYSRTRWVSRGPFHGLWVKHGVLNGGKANGVLTQYCELLLDTDMIICPGNKGVITRINNQMEYNHYYTSNILDLNWDAIKKYANIFTVFTNHMTLMHVKGHQDDNINYD